MEYLWRHVKDSFLMGEGEKVRREDPKKSKTGNKLKQDQVQRWKKGDPLTEDDHKMLDLLIRYYEKHGIFTITKRYAEQYSIETTVWYMEKCSHSCWITYIE